MFKRQLQIALMQKSQILHQRNAFADKCLTYCAGLTKLPCTVTPENAVTPTTLM